MLRSRLRTQPISRAIAAVLGVAAATLGVEALAAADAADPFKIFVSDRFTYEDNLFRVPQSVLAGDPAAVGIGSFDDYVNRLSGGIEARIDASRQVFSLNLRFDDVSYSENDYLDYHGGSGDLRWNFDIGKRWSGLIDARYDRQQAGFSNYELFVKDIVETQSYIGELRFKIGSRWALMAGGTFSESTHSADVRQTSNMESESGRFGIEYQTPNNSLVALDYAFTDATFPEAGRLFNREIGYEQTLPGFRLRYVFSEKTRINARGGYLKRDYSNPAAGDFSGNVWNISAYWEPRAQIYFNLEAYRELTAYTDAEADYFVATGLRVTPTWSPTPLMTFELGLTIEDQSYRAVATPFSDTGSAPGREDDVKSAGLTWRYTPRNFLDLSLGYRWIERDSNFQRRTHEAEVASAQLRIIF